MLSPPDELATTPVSVTASVVDALEAEDEPDEPPVVAPVAVEDALALELVNTTPETVLSSVTVVITGSAHATATTLSADATTRARHNIPEPEPTTP